MSKVVQGVFFWLGKIRVQTQVSFGLNSEMLTEVWNDINTSMMERSGLVMINFLTSAIPPGALWEILQL